MKDSIRKLSMILITVMVTHHLLAQNGPFAGYAYSKVTLDNIKMDSKGYADKESLVPYDTLTIQNIGSISKTFVGVSILIAQEKGLLDLDTDINNYLDFEVNHPDGIITLRQLATHTSGIKDKDLYYLKAYSKSKVPKIELSEYLKRYLNTDGSAYGKGNFNAGAPGTTYEYSNIGAALAAYVVESVSQTKFSEFTKIHILQPLGMHHSGWSYAEIDESRHATLYKPNGKPAGIYTLVTYPDGGMRTNVLDLSIYLQELIKGYNHSSSLMSNDSWDQLFAKNFELKRPKNVEAGGYDSGIFMSHTKQGKIGHTGSDPGVTTVMRFDPETLEGKVLITNSEVTKKTSEDFREIWDNIK